MSAWTRIGEPEPPALAASTPSSSRSTNARSPALSTFGTTSDAGPLGSDASATMSA